MGDGGGWGFSVVTELIEGFARKYLMLANYGKQAQRSQSFFGQMLVLQKTQLLQRYKPVSAHCCYCDGHSIGG